MTFQLNLEATRSPYISGERIYLRRLAISDVGSAYLEWMNSALINRYLESRFQVHTVEDLRNFVGAMAEDPCNLFLGIFLHGEDRHIGNIKLGSISTRHFHADIGLLIGDRDCWGRGYAGEAISLVTDFAFNVVGLRRVYAGAYADNEGSCRAFERAGYLREGLLRDQWYCDGEFQDGVILGKVNPAPFSHQEN